MENLKKHIEKLSCLLKDKGYTGYFLSGGGHPGKLEESLTALTGDLFKTGPDTDFSTSLTTYSHWKDERSDSVECRFAIDYNKTKGFLVKNVGIESHDRYGVTVDKKTIPVATVSDIPECHQANALVTGNEAKIMQKRKKGMRF
jgi:hypothetical protein